MEGAGCDEWLVRWLVRWLVGWLKKVEQGVQVKGAKGSIATGLYDEYRRDEAGRERELRERDES